MSKIKRVAKGWKNNKGEYSKALKIFLFFDKNINIFSSISPALTYLFLFIRCYDANIKKISNVSNVRRNARISRKCIRKISFEINYPMRTSAVLSTENIRKAKSKWRNFQTSNHREIQNVIKKFQPKMSRPEHNTIFIYLFSLNSKKIYTYNNNYSTTILSNIEAEKIHCA